jgi:hypothetical protein
LQDENSSIQPDRADARRTVRKLRQNRVRSSFCIAAAIVQGRPGSQPIADVSSHSLSSFYGSATRLELGIFYSMANTPTPTKL